MNDRVQYFARGPAYTLALTDREMHLVPKGAGAGEVVVSFPGSQPVAIEPLDRLPFHINSIHGSDPSHWVMNAEAWSRLRYRQIEPGVDLVIHPAESTREWEFDFEIAPGADPSRVEFDVRGAASLTVDAQGDLEAHTRDGNTVRWHRPASFQDSGPARTAIATRFAVSGTRVRFKVGPWDRHRPLTIDPSFAFSTYFGGDGDDLARGIAVDNSGNIYICGATNSGNLPTTRASFQASYHGGSAYNIGDAFLAKFNSTGTLTYVTYFGGSADDLATGLAIDTSGNVYMTGHTASSDFPVMNPFQSFSGDLTNSNNYGEGGDAFVAKFTPAGALSYSSPLGGAGDDAGLAITVDTSGNAYVTGYTLSANFPMATGYQQRYGGTSGAFVRNGYLAYNLGDAFVSKISSAGQLLISTYLGGQQDEAADAITLDSAGNVWVGGATTSILFPVVNGLPGGYHGGSPPSLQPVANLGDGFVSKFNSGLTQLLYSTYLGGNGDDAVTALVVDSTGSAYAAGLTLSTNFPVTSSAYQKTYAGPTTLAVGAGAVLGDAFVAKFNPSGSALTYCTLLGGSNNDFATGLAVDGAGNAYITGSTSSTPFPVAGAPLGSGVFGGPSIPGIMGDAFVAEFDPTGQNLLYSSYLGGNGQDIALGLTLNDGIIYVTGLTASTNFPTQTPYQKSLLSQTTGGYNSFVTAISGLSTGPALNAVTNIASYSTAGVAPGEVVLLFGTGLGPSTIGTAQLDPTTGLVSSNLYGTQVFFDSIAAPMVYTLDLQVAAVAPYELAGKTSTQVTVHYNGGISNTLTVPVLAAQPGLFSADSSGSGEGAIYNQDSTANSPTNPAAEGTVITFFGTGQGPTTPALVDGELVTNVSPQQVPVQPLTVMFDNIPATEIDYSGPIPDLVAGFWQLDVRLPAGVGTGTHQVTVSVGGAKSQSNFTIAVK